MSNYTVIQHIGRTSTRVTKYDTTLSALKRAMTLALKDQLDKVVILDSNGGPTVKWTRSRGDTKWTRIETPKGETP